MQDAVDTGMPHRLPVSPLPGCSDRDVPLLFRRREAILADPRMGSTTTCQTTRASDWTPDD